MKSSNVIGIVFVLVFALFTLGVVTGCDSQQNVTREDVGAFRQILDDLKVKAEANDPNALVDTEGNATTFGDVLLHLEEATDIAETATSQGLPDAIERGGEVIGQYMPAPWKLPTVLGTALVAALMRSAYNRQAARRIAASVNDILSNPQNPTIDKAKIRQEQGVSAGRIVDEAQGKVLKLPL